LIGLKNIARCTQRLLLLLLLLRRRRGGGSRCSGFCQLVGALYYRAAQIHFKAELRFKHLISHR
jgi:hypothetical protein